MQLVFSRRVLAARMAGILALSSVLSVVGCGGNSSPAPSGWVDIITPPASQVVPIGRTATFTVTSAGPSLTYQWSKNGVAIPEATASSYTTPTVSLADSGTQYTVTVTSDSQASETSSAATLTAGPRAPAIGDVRYLLWQQTGPRNDSEPMGAGILGGGTESITNALGTPLELGYGAQYCGWPYGYLVLPTSMEGQYATYYELDFTQMESWQSYLESVNADSNVVVFSADLEPGCQELAVAWVQVQAGGFDYKLEEVPASEVSATIANDGSESRIVTAVFYDSAASEWALISYGWQGDRTTVYESQVGFAADFWTQAQTFANQGYFISTVGGNDTVGYLVVGMRVQGDTMARPIMGVGGVPANVDNAFWTVFMYYGIFYMEQ